MKRAPSVEILNQLKEKKSRELESYNEKTKGTVPD
jgi:hypothetical protein